MSIWGYGRKGRYYSRKTGTRRYPDTGEIESGGKKVGMEKVNKNIYGDDRRLKKKTLSKRYRYHNFRSHGKLRTRGGYRKLLR